MPKETDSWADNEFAPLDLREGPEPLVAQLGEIADENPEIAPTAEEIAAADGVPEATPEPAAPPVPEPAASEPEVLKLEDGSTVTIEKTNKGWKATLSGSSGASAEIFYGETQRKLLQNVAVSKINATKKIRELNRKTKLGIGEEAEPTPTVPATKPEIRQLTADEIFEIKTKLASDPDLALQEWFQKKTGMTVDQLVRLAQQGQQAREELDMEGVAREFMAATPEYFAHPENFRAMVAWLAKHKLGRSLTGRNQEEIMTQLVQTGKWTVKNLSEAYEELSEAGLLETAPQASAEETVEEEPAAPAKPAAVAPATPPSTPAPDPRIASTRVRQRPGAFGVRQTDVSNTPPVSDKPVSDEEFDNLSDADLEKLMADVRHARAGTRR